MTDYKGIKFALECAIGALQADLTFLKEVKASRDIIEQHEAHIIFLDEAKDIVWRYQELES